MCAEALRLKAEGHLTGVAPCQPHQILGEENMKTYCVRVNGKARKEIEMPDDTNQSDRNIKKRELGRELKVPAHYVYLQPKVLVDVPEEWDDN